MSHLLRGQLIDGFVIELIRLLDVAHFEVEISKTGEVVPRSFLLDQCFVIIARLVITALLKVEIRFQCAAGKTVQQITPCFEIFFDLVEAVNFEMNVGFQKVKIAVGTEMLNRMVQRFVGD